MGSRWVIWVLSVVCALALVAGVSRTALAAAPICDDRAASAIAPPPVAPLGDRTWEPAPPQICIVSVPPAVDRLVPDPPQSPANEGDGADGSFALPERASLPRPAVECRAFAASRLFLPSGHYRPIFRPPERVRLFEPG